MRGPWCTRACRPGWPARPPGPGERGAPARRSGGWGSAAFGLPALDALLEGGVTARTSTLLVGSAGVGKTLLGLHFALEGVRAGQPAVFLGFHEDLGEIRHKAASFAIGPALEAALLPGGGLALLRQPSVERDADVLVDELLDAVDRAGARRVVIDSIGELERAVRETSGAARIPSFLSALVEALRLRGATTVLIRETGMVAATSLTQQADMVSLTAANVIWLQQIVFRDRLYRVLSVPKMRFSGHDVTLREYRIVAPEGLRVLAPIDSGAGILAGIARQEGQAGAAADAAP